MPSAAKGGGSAAENGDTMTVVMSVVEKKARNLEKKRARQLELKQKSDEGAELDKDQKEALDRLVVTEALLGFAKDLQKQFAQMQQEIQRQSKKKAHQDRQAVEAAIQESEQQALEQIFRLQAVLDQLGEENRVYFLNGTSGAVLVSQEQLEQIDKFLELTTSASLVNTTGADVKYSETVAKVCEHAHLYVRRSTKSIGQLRMTYKEMHELIDQIESCDFFSQSASRLASASEDVAQVDHEGLDAIAHSEMEQHTQAEVADLASSGLGDPSSRGGSVPRDQPLAVVPPALSLSVDPLSQPSMTMPTAAAPPSYSVFAVTQPETADTGIDFFHESKVFHEPGVSSLPSADSQPMGDYHSTGPPLDSILQTDATPIDNIDDEEPTPDDANDQQDEGSHGGYSRGAYRGYRGGERGYGRRGRGSYRGGGGRGGQYRGERNERGERQEWSGQPSGRGGYRGRGTRGRGRGGNRGGNGGNYRGGYKNQQPVQQAA